jgi:hypothetical protein
MVADGVGLPRGIANERPDGHAVDFAEIALHAASAQVTYQAALETNAQVREFSLLNFLR